MLGGEINVDALVEYPASLPHQVLVFVTRCLIHPTPSPCVTQSSKTIFCAEDLYCLSGICLNSLVFTISQQLVNRKPEPTLLPTQGDF